MKRTYVILVALLLAFLFTVPVFAQEATQAAESSPTVEAPAPVSEPAADGNTPLDWMQFVIDNQLHWYVFAFITVLFVGNLVPQSELASRREAAKKTDTPVDDTLIMILELVQSIKGTLPTQPAAPTLPAPTQPTVTVNTPNPVATAPTLPTLSDELDKLRNAPSVIVQPLNVPINPNSTLKAFKATEWAGGRAKDVPDTFDVVWQPFKLDDPYAPPPELHTKENGLQVEVSHRRGRLLLSQNLPMIIPTQRYLLKVTVACDLKLKADMPAITGAIAVHGQLLSDGAVLKQLDAWSPQNTEDATGEFEALWVFEFGRKLPNIEYLVEVRIGTLDSVPFDDLSHITLQGIEVIPVAANFGGTEVYRV